jgi:hypothetical protein
MDDDNISMNSSTMVNIIDNNDPLTKKIFQNNNVNRISEVQEIEEEKYEGDSNIDDSYIDSNSN